MPASNASQVYDRDENFPNRAIFPIDAESESSNCEDFLEFFQNFSQFFLNFLMSNPKIVKFLNSHFIATTFMKQSRRELQCNDF